MAVCTLDADGAVLRYNRMADRLCGGGLASDGRLRILCADGRLQPLADTPLGDTLRTGRATQDVTLLIERADGIPAAVLANIDALRSDTGQITGAILCFQCSTPGRARHADQRHQVEWLRAIVDNTPECVKVVDRDGTLLQMNPAGLRMVEASAPDEVEGGCVIDLIAPEHRDSWREHHQRVCDGEKLSWQFDVISLKGTRRHMETHAVPMPMPGDGKIGKGRFVQLAITHDITERKRLASAHLEAELRLRNLLDALPTAVYTTDAKGWSPTSTRHASSWLGGCRRSARTNGVSSGDCAGPMARSSRQAPVQWRLRLQRTGPFTAWKPWHNGQTVATYPFSAIRHRCATRPARSLAPST